MINATARIEMVARLESPAVMLVKLKQQNRVQLNTRQQGTISRYYWDWGAYVSKLKKSEIFKHLPLRRRQLLIEMNAPTTLLVQPRRQFQARR